MKNPNPKHFPDWVLDTLCNDENATDEGMVRYFMDEGKVSEERARTWVAERAYYGGIAYLNDCLANAREYRAARERGERHHATLAAARA